ncbi:hypothetical protein VPH219E481_0056 [Vibrio phage 219E48-1]|nr:hypothetical protein PODOV021v1_p0045 [Vibrio phage 219E41.2]QZI91089.1 hypothetical protein PODOV032v1_p0084 [Vibrio phage 219E41.1]
MQRKPSKKTRGVNADEKRFMSWVKTQSCICCGNDYVIVDHCMGATYKHNRVLIGMWYLIPLCQLCDNIKTQGSRRGFREQFGPMSELWLKLIENYQEEIPSDVIEAITDSKT